MRETPRASCGTVERDAQDWAQTIDGNLEGTRLSMKHEISAMAERGGAIVNIASIAAIAGSSGRRRVAK